MRVLEGARLRVKDVEFSRKEILVRDGKGYKDRVTMLPLALVNPLKDHLKRVKGLARKRVGGRLRESVLALCVGEEISKRGGAVDVAVCVSRNEAFRRSALGGKNAAIMCKIRRFSARLSKRCVKRA